MTLLIEGGSQNTQGWITIDGFNLLSNAPPSAHTEREGEGVKEGEGEGEREGEREGELKCA